MGDALVDFLYKMNLHLYVEILPIALIGFFAGFISNSRNELLENFENKGKKKI